MVTVYSKSSCVQCTATYRKLTANGLEFQVIDVEESTEAAEYVKSLGYSQAPVVVTGDDHWSGFRPDKIDALAARAA